MTTIQYKKLLRKNNGYMHAEKKMEIRIIIKFYGKIFDFRSLIIVDYYVILRQLCIASYQIYIGGTLDLSYI